MHGGRHRAVRVRVSNEEHERLTALADGAGVSVARLLVEAALRAGGPTPAERRAQFAALLAARRQLAGRRPTSTSSRLGQHGRPLFGWFGAGGGPVERATERLEAALEALAL